MLQIVPQNMTSNAIRRAKPYYLIGAGLMGISSVSLFGGMAWSLLHFDEIKYSVFSIERGFSYSSLIGPVFMCFGFILYVVGFNVAYTRKNAQGRPDLFDKVH